MIPETKHNDVKSLYRTFAESFEGAAAYSRYQRLLYGIEDSLLKSVVPFIMATLESMPRRSWGHVFDVGAGDGRRSREMFDNVSALCDCNARFALIEPSVPMINTARQVFLGYGKEVEFVINYSEEYRLADQPSMYFFIHSIFAMDAHFLYWRFERICSKGGVIVIVGDCSGSVIRRLKNIFDYGQKRGTRTSLDDIERFIPRLPVQAVSFDYNVFFSVPRQEFFFAEEVMGNWLSLGKFSTLGTEVKSAFRSELLSSAVEIGGRYGWSESERVLIISAG